MCTGPPPTQDIVRGILRQLVAAWRDLDSLHDPFLAADLQTAVDALDRVSQRLVDHGPAPPLGQPFTEERIVPRTFGLLESAVQTVEEAIVRAQELRNAGGLDPGSTSLALSLVCMDFLATNTFGKKGDLSARRHFLKKLEAHLDLKLVAIERDEVVYGLMALLRLGGEGA